MAARSRHASGVLTLLLVASCASPSTPPVGPGGGGKPRPKPSGTPGVLASASPLGIVPVASGAPVLGGPSVPGLDPGGGLISDNGASLTGKVKGPSGLIANNSGSLISDSGGGLIGRTRLISNNSGSLISDGGGGLIGRTRYALQAVDEVPYANLPVALLYADGTPVEDEKGAEIKGTTDANGAYALPYKGGDRHVLVVADLPGNRGSMVALVPRGKPEAAKPVDADLVSTLTLGYIHEKYVRTQADPATVFERLPAELEAATRQAVAAAVAKEAAPPAALTPAAVIDAVDRLRSADGAVAAKLEEVRAVLLAGLSDQGAGQPAEAVEPDAESIAISPAGEVIYSGTQTGRVWKKDAAGKLTPIAGSGLVPIVDPKPGEAAPGDGGPALKAPMAPVAIGYTSDGTLLIADNYHQRIRAMAPDGTITTRAARADWKDMRDMVVLADGSALLATHSALWRVPVSGEPTLLAGEVRAFDTTAWVKMQATGDGGPPSAARFAHLFDIAVGPAGEIYTYESQGVVRRFDADTVTRIGGNGTAGYAGDGGPAAAAQLGLLGGVVVRGDGTLVISDASNRRIREVVGGVIRTIAGTGLSNFAGDGGPALGAGLGEPRGLTRAPDGSIYFADQGYVRRLADGVVTTVIGGTRGFDVPRSARDVQLNGPSGVTYDAATHTMFVNDARHVWRWSLADDKMVSIFGGGPGGAPFVDGQAPAATKLYLPGRPLAIGPNKYLILAADPDSLTGRVLQVENDATMTAVAGGGPLEAGSADRPGPALGNTIVYGDTNLIAHDGWYYYNIMATGRILRFQIGGNVERWGGYGTADPLAEGAVVGNAGLDRIHTLAMGPDGHMYVGEVGRIFRVDMATKKLTHVAGAGWGDAGDGGPALEAKFGYPNGLAWDPAGNLYFTEPEYGRVRRIRKDTGKIEKVAGAGSANFAGDTVDTGMAGPVGLAFDKNGDLYVADLRHGQIKVVPKAKLGL